jgi:hypothetical protein
MDTMLESFLKSLSVRHKEITRADAVAHVGELTRFFVLDLTYKNTPVRLILAASTVPRGLLASDPKVTNVEPDRAAKIEPGTSPDRSPAP